MKNKVSAMNEDEIKNYLQEKAEHWKDILRNNCITLTKVWEEEGEMVELLKNRYEKIQGQFNAVSASANEYRKNIADAHAEIEAIDKREIELKSKLVELISQQK